MTITASDEVYRRLEEVKEWLESRLAREATFDEVLLELLDHVEIVEHPEDLGSG
jgi:predicted CopG family antitoxin